MAIAVAWSDDDGYLASRQRRRRGLIGGSARRPGLSGFVWLGRFWQLVFSPGGAAVNSQG